MGRYAYICQQGNVLFFPHANEINQEWFEGQLHKQVFGGGRDVMADARRRLEEKEANNPLYKSHFSFCILIQKCPWSDYSITLRGSG